MTAPAQTMPAAPPMRVVHGILCVEFAMLFYAVQDVAMKSLLENHSVWLLIFLRAVVSVIILVPLVLWLGAPHRILTPLWPIHAIRGTFFAIAFSLFYTAFPLMGLAEVVTIFFSAPLITALLAALYLKETIGWHRAGALMVGFCGVLIAMNPGGETFSYIALLPILCALLYAITQIIARQIGERETTLTVGLHTLFFSGVAIIPFGYVVSVLIGPSPEFQHLQFRFSDVDHSGWPILLFMSCVGMVGYLLLSRAYQVAPASMIAPFDYTYLPIAVGLSYFFFDEAPATSTLIGMSLIILAGLYLGSREIRAVRRSKDTPPPTAEAVFAPSSPLPAQIPEAEMVFSSVRGRR